MQIIEEALESTVDSRQLRIESDIQTGISAVLCSPVWECAEDTRRIMVAEGLSEEAIGAVAALTSEYEQQLSIVKIKMEQRLLAAMIKAMPLAKNYVDVEKMYDVWQVYRRQVGRLLGRNLPEEVTGFIDWAQQNPVRFESDPFICDLLAFDQAYLALRADFIRERRPGRSQTCQFAHSIYSYINDKKIIRARETLTLSVVESGSIKVSVN